MAHDKTIYWAYDTKGKISDKQYRGAKATKKPLKTLATLKLDRTHEITDSTDPGEGSSASYIVSSEPISKLVNRRSNESNN